MSLASVKHVFAFVACFLVSHYFSRGFHMGDAVFGLPSALSGVTVGVGSRSSETEEKTCPAHVMGEGISVGG